jgi:predicted Zn-ribbon and HTH transcriptional regulator
MDAYDSLELKTALERSRFGIQWWIDASGTNLNEIHRMTGLSRGAVYALNLDTEGISRVAQLIDRRRPISFENDWTRRLESLPRDIFMLRMIVRDSSEPEASARLASFEQELADLTLATSPLAVQWEGLSLVEKPSDARDRHCLRCDNRWSARTIRPQRCPRCRSDIWDDVTKAMVPVIE